MIGLSLIHRDNDLRDAGHSRLTYIEHLPANAGIIAEAALHVGVHLSGCRQSRFCARIFINLGLRLWSEWTPCGWFVAGILCRSQRENKSQKTYESRNF